MMTAPTLAGAGARVN